MSAPQRTFWGWHRLSDEWAARLVQRAGVEPGDLVLDIGAGDGAITDQLLRAGARVVAVELHPERARHLRDRYLGAPVRVVRVDATALRPPAQPFRVVANPPFAATTGLLRRVLTESSLLVHAELVVPRHVAARWSSGRGHDAHRWHRRFDVTFGGHMPSSAFRPPPPNPVAMLSIAARPSHKRR